jgi:hypothetical protein
MAVAVLGVGSRARGVLSLGVVLVRNVLCKVWRNHLSDLLRLLLVYVFCAVSVHMPSALGKSLMVVAMHQGGVRVDRSSGNVV